MKTLQARNNSGDDWATPPDLYNKLNDIYNFDFDPCPYQSTFNGLTIEWGKSNFVNPPYSRKLKEAFVKKALAESKKGKVCVLLLPVSTSTNLFHDIILPNAKKIEFIKGRVCFGKKDSNGQFIYDKCGQHDSMIIVF